MNRNTFHKCFLLFFVLAFFTCTLAFPQKFILLQKGANQKTRLKYEIGEYFTYKTKDYDFFITDIIQDIQKDIILLSENVLRPEDIVSVDVRNKDPRNSTLKNLSALSYGAGGIFLLTDLINGLYQNSEVSIGTGTLITSGILFTTGFTLSKIQYRQFKNKGRNKIQLIILYGE